MKNKTRQEVEESQKEKMIKEILRDNDIEIIDNKIGSGGYGDVVKVRDKTGRIYAMKIIVGKNEEKVIEKVKEFRGKNIIKINYEFIKHNEYYFKKRTYDIYIYIYLMEYSDKGDFDKFIQKYHNKNYSHFFLEKMGYNLTRYFAYQLITALKSFYEGNLVHFDIKPKNILMFKNLEIKLIDFSNLKKLEENKKIIFGTHGYVTPEAFDENKIYENKDILRAQDYFALGATMFYLKYGKIMLNYLNDFSYDNNDVINNINRDIVVLYLDKAINYIKTRKYQDKDFTNFLCSLIQFKPEYRPNFEKIIRNKWLNKNREEIENILCFNRISEEHNDINLINEFQKSDFLLDEVKNKRKKFDEKNDRNDKLYIYNRRGKFKFGKKNKIF